MNLRAIQRAFDIERYVKARFSTVKEYAPNLVVCDPVCGKEEKLWILTQDKVGGVKAGAWQCFFCGDSGRDALSLVRRIEDCSKYAALGIMTDHTKAGVTTTDLRELVVSTLFGLKGVTTEWDTSFVKPMDLPDEFIPWTKERQRVPTYFKERGITYKRAKRYGLGWCEGGYFHNRLIVPVVFDGRTVFWVARYMAKTPPAGVKKVIYPKGCQTNRVLYNYDRARKHDQIILVEDVWSAMHVGPQAVATFGTSLSQYQLELLLDSRAHEIVLLWDRDAIDKAKKLALRLADFWSVRVVELPDVRDPDEHKRAAVSEMIAATPSQSASDAFKSLVLGRL